MLHRLLQVLVTTYTIWRRAAIFAKGSRARERTIEDLGKQYKQPCLLGRTTQNPRIRQICVDAVWSLWMREKDAVWSLWQAPIAQCPLELKQTTLGMVQCLGRSWALHHGTSRVTWPKLLIMMKCVLSDLPIHMQLSILKLKRYTEDQFQIGTSIQIDE